MSEAPDDGDWGVYILRCGDGSLYTGVAKELWARFAAHASGRGARYTRGRGPLEVVFWEEGHTRGSALSLEARIKRLPAATKRLLTT